MKQPSVSASPPAASHWLVSPWPLLLSVCAAAALWILLLGNPAENLEMRWLGQMLRWRSELGWAPPADPHIIHVDIGTRDLEALPTLELEYRNAARVIRDAVDLGAKVIAFDAVFLRGDAAVSRPIADEISKAREQGRSVIMAEALMQGGENAAVNRVRSFPFRERHTPAGLINVQADPDGVFRRYEYARRTKDVWEPSLALASYLAWREVAWDGGVKVSENGALRWEEIAADFSSTETRELRAAVPMLLNFRSSWNGASPAAFHHYSVAQMEELHGKLRAAESKPFDNALVIVSYVGAGFGDVGTTQMGVNQPRSHLHSTALNDLIQRNWLRRTPRPVDALSLIAALLLGGAGTFCRRTIPRLLLWAVGTFAVAALGAVLFLKTGWVGASVMIGIVWTVATAIEVVRRHSCELIERLKLRATMSLYFSPHVLERVLKNPGSMEPQEAELTVLLTDLRNSTPIVECVGAHGTFGLLNQVFEAQTRAVMAEDGSLEHFLGDQFLSYWGAPDPQPDAADRAFRAALALIAAMEELRPTLQPNVRDLFGYGVCHPKPRS